MGYIKIDGELVDFDHPDTLFMNSDSFSIEDIVVIGVTSDGYMIYVNGDDPVTTPHYHYRDAAWRHFHCCLRLDKPEYCEHGGRQDKLSDEQKRHLMDFLSGQKA